MLYLPKSQCPSRGGSDITYGMDRREEFDSDKTTVFIGQVSLLLLYMSGDFDVQMVVVV